ncbi:MAG: class I SAM-dependent methyltransferase [Saprospiraceae bacterium]|nr:class I SAM-dependent methyltransferase [Saprospiraceae bacterium]
MKRTTEDFKYSYTSYYSFISKSFDNHIKKKVLEIGGGAHPSITERSNLKYTIIDPDPIELKKSPEDCYQICSTLQEYNEVGQFDLIISKMVLEHVEEPDSFHEKARRVLKDNGTIIHFFACRHSIPAMVNRLLPESFGNALLRVLKNRNTEAHPKYPAFYKRTKGGVKSQIQYFENLGFSIQTYNSYVGHKYFQSFPVLKQLEQLYTWILVQLKMKSLATVALVVLKKKK